MYRVVSAAFALLLCGVALMVHLDIFDSQIIAQNISWSPWSRLYLQVGFNYVLSETKTPAADYTSAILNAQNNYWTVNFNSGFVLDNKTDQIRPPEETGYSFISRQSDFDPMIWQRLDAAGHAIPRPFSPEEMGLMRELVRQGFEQLNGKVITPGAG
jgi:hypothetical protein